MLYGFMQNMHENRMHFQGQKLVLIVSHYWQQWILNTFFNKCYTSTHTCAQ